MTSNMITAIGIGATVIETAASFTIGKVKTNTILRISVVAVGVGAAVVSGWVADKKMEVLIEQKVKEALAKKEAEKES